MYGFNCYSRQRIWTIRSQMQTVDGLCPVLHFVNVPGHSLGNAKMCLAKMDIENAYILLHIFMFKPMSNKCKMSRFQQSAINQALQRKTRDGWATPSSTVNIEVKRSIVCWCPSPVYWLFSVKFCTVLNTYIYDDIFQSEIKEI